MKTGIRSDRYQKKLTSVEFKRKDGRSENAQKQTYKNDKKLPGAETNVFAKVTRNECRLERSVTIHERDTR